MVRETRSAGLLEKCPELWTLSLVYGLPFRGFGFACGGGDWLVEQLRFRLCSSMPNPVFLTNPGLAKAEMFLFLTSLHGWLSRRQALVLPKTSAQLSSIIMHLFFFILHIKSNIITQTRCVYIKHINNIYKIALL